MSWRYLRLSSSPHRRRSPQHLACGSVTGRFASRTASPCTNLTQECQSALLFPNATGSAKPLPPSFSPLRVISGIASSVARSALPGWLLDRCRSKLRPCLGSFEAFGACENREVFAEPPGRDSRRPRKARRTQGTAPTPAPHLQVESPDPPASETCINGRVSSLSRTALRLRGNDRKSLVRVCPRE